MVPGNWLGQLRIAATDRHSRPDGIVARSHGNVDVFENFSRGDATGPVGRFNQIIANVALVLTAESIDEEERFGELAGSN